MSKRRIAWLVLALALVALASLYRGELDPSELESRYTNDESRFAEVDGVRVHYRVEGEGSSLVLIHGTASSLHTWDGWVDELRGELQLIRMDLTGFGLTGPDATGDYGAARRVQVLIGLLDQLAIGRFAVAGNSLGGYLAAELTIRHPERVDRLILVDPAGYPLWRAGGWTVMDLARVPLLKTVLSRWTPRLLVAAGVRQSYGDSSKVTPALIDRYYELLRRRGNRAALIAGLTSEGQLDPAELASIEQPTLILWGREDRLISVELGESFRKSLPNSRLLIYDQVGHVPMEEIPERTAADVRGFLLEDAISLADPGV